MRFFTFLLILAFFITGFILPSVYGIQANNTSTEADCACSSSNDDFAVCETIKNKGYLFYTYLINVTVDTTKEDGFICDGGFESDIDVRTDTNFIPTFFESVSDARKNHLKLNGDL